MTTNTQNKMTFEDILRDIPTVLQYKKPIVSEWETYTFDNINISKELIIQRLKRHLKTFKYYNENVEFIGREVSLATYHKFRDIFNEELNKENAKEIILDYVYEHEGNYKLISYTFSDVKIVRELAFELIEKVPEMKESVINSYFWTYLYNKKYREFSKIEKYYFKDIAFKRLEQDLEGYDTFSALAKKVVGYTSEDKEYSFIRKFIKSEIEKRNYQYSSFKGMLEYYKIDTDSREISVEDINTIFKWYNKQLNAKQLIDNIANKEPFDLLFKEVISRYVEMEEGVKTQIYMNVSGKEVVKRLKAFMQINGNHMCKVTAKIKLADGRERNLTRQNQFLNTIIFDFEEEFVRFVEFYDENMPVDDDTAIYENTKVVELLITMRQSKIKKGILHYEIIDHKNEVYCVSYPETINRCILEACLLHNKNRDNLYKNFDVHVRKYDEAKNYEDQIKIVETYLKKKITLSDKRNINYVKDTLNLFLSGNHAGRLDLINDINLPSYTLNKEYKSIEYKLMTEIVIITVDCEWEWVFHEDGSVRSGEPCMVSYQVLENKALGVLGCQGIFSSFAEFYVLLSKFKDMPYKTYVYSHNGSSVEHYFIIKEFIINSDKSKKFMKEFKNVSGTKIKSFKIRNIEFRDSLLYLDCSLSEAGHLATTYKKFEDHPELLEYKKRIPDPIKAAEEWYLHKKWDINNAEDYKYALYDSLALMDILLGLNRILVDIHKTAFSSLGVINNLFMLTPASISGIVKDCIYNILGNNINSPMTAALADRLYVGGNNQAFHIGEIKSPGFIIDINSSYPFQMTKPLPGKITYISKNISKNPHLLWHGLFKIKFNEDYRPKFNLLPLKKFGRILFPTIATDGIYALTDFEYNYLMKNITIVETYYILYYEKKETLRPFMQTQFKDRLEIGKKTGAGLAKKVFMNRGYGAMATNKRRNIKVINHKENEVLEKRLMDISMYAKVDCEFVENLQWTTYNQFSLPDNMCHTAAYITALARFQLYEMILLLDSLGFDVVYVDTDSVFVIGDYELFKDLFPDTEALGAWSCTPDTDVFTEITIYACKDYKYTCTNGKIVTKQKGQSKKYYEWRRSLGKMDIRLIHQDKEFTRIYHKGDVNENGTVTPFII
jgi:hypothetical protein